jgi:hypothetical protein
MDAKQTAQINGAGRAVIGAALTIAPTLAARGWIGDDAASPGGRVLGRALGLRDLVLGAGLVQAIAAGEPTRGWIAAAAAADAIDATATLLNWGALPRAGRIGILALAAGSAVQMGMLAATADE